MFYCVLHVFMLFYIRAYMVISFYNLFITFYNFYIVFVIDFYNLIYVHIIVFITFYKFL